jgi:hypothetical protein
MPNVDAGPARKKAWRERQAFELFGGPYGIQTCNQRTLKDRISLLNPGPTQLNIGVRSGSPFFIARR